MKINISKVIWQHFQTMPTGSKRCRISVASCIRFCDSRLQYNYISSLSGFSINQFMILILIYNSLYKQLIIINKLIRALVNIFILLIQTRQFIGVVLLFNFCSGLRDFYDFKFRTHLNWHQGNSMRRIITTIVVNKTSARFCFVLDRKFTSLR